jgi:hypothetical protein
MSLIFVGDDTDNGEIETLNSAKREACNYSLGKYY